MRYGMSERLGPRVFGHDRGQPFLGREFSSEPDYSDEIAREIDDEIRRVVEEAHQTAKDILNERRDELESLTKILLERETIDAKEFVALLDGASEEEVFGSADDEGGSEPTADAGDESAPRVRARGTALDHAAAASRLRRRRRGDARRRARPRLTPPLTRESRRSADNGAVTDGHGHRQRDPGLVLGRRALPRRRGGDRARTRAARGRAPTSSTSAASRRAPGRPRSAPRRSRPASCR